MKSWLFVKVITVCGKKKCQFLYYYTYRLKSNKELLESNFSIVGKLAKALNVFILLSAGALLLSLKSIFEMITQDWPWFWHVYCVIFTEWTGDDGSSEEPQQGVLVKESESLYTLWCTGRVGCDGLLVEIKVRPSMLILSYFLCWVFSIWIY